MLRRSFIQSCGLGAIGLTALGAEAKFLRAAPNVAPRGSAENLIIVFLQGGQSHVDTFDVKKGNWTPSDFEIGTFGNIELPAGLFPNLAQNTDKFSLLRCLSGNEAVHQRASYLLETAHTFNPTFSKEQPHLGSLIAYELGPSRTANDILPTFLALNGIVQGPGLLPSSYSAFSLDSRTGVAGLEHPGGEALFRKRYESLLRFDGKARTGASPHGAAISDYHGFYELGEGMMYEPDAQEVFSITDSELERYGESGPGLGCAIAVKAIAKGRGTRVVQVNHGGWDNHYDIYDRNQANNIYSQSQELDKALAATLVDLATLPGQRGGSLLDETMLVVTGEFGRTPASLTGNLGRDHYPNAWSALVAGAGMVANQTFGATDAEGRTISDPFWSTLRYITIQDLAATMYSSLGIDWTKEIQDTPSGRVYEYTPKVDGQAGYYKEISGMFA